MENMSLSRPQERARQETSTDERCVESLDCPPGYFIPLNPLADEALFSSEITDVELICSSLSAALDNGEVCPDFKPAQHSINSSPSKIQPNLEPQTQPQLQLQPSNSLADEALALSERSLLRQILLLAATDVIETLLLRLNHYFEGWKKSRNLRSGRRIPSSYSDMVYNLHKLSPFFEKAMDYVESAFLRDLQMRGYGQAIELKELLRRDLTAYLTKAKREGGRNDVAHLFSTSVRQHCKNSSPGKVRCLFDTAVDDLTRSRKEYELQILDLLSDSQNLPKCYRDLAQVAFPLQIFFLRNVIE